MDWPPDGWKEATTWEQRRSSGWLSTYWRGVTQYVANLLSPFARVGGAAVILGLVFGGVLAALIISFSLSVWTVSGVIGLLNTNAGAVLSVAVGVILYRLYTDSRTAHFDHHISDDGDTCWIELKNRGIFNTEYRVRLKVDGANPKSHTDMEKNCLYPQVSSGDSSVGKSAHIPTGDIRKFRNQVPADPKIASLPVSTGDHTVEFIVDQSNEHYRIEYAASDGEIEHPSIEYADRYGGATIGDIIRSLLRGKLDFVPVLGRLKRHWL